MLWTALFALKQFQSLVVMHHTPTHCFEKLGKASTRVWDKVSFYPIKDCSALPHHIKEFFLSKLVSRHNLAITFHKFGIISDKSKESSEGLEVTSLSQSITWKTLSWSLKWDESYVLCGTHKKREKQKKERGKEEEYEINSRRVSPSLGLGDDYPYTKSLFFIITK